MEVNLDFLTIQVTLAFLLALTRMLAMMMIAPVFSRREIPNIVKVGFAAVMVIGMYGAISKSTLGLMPSNEWELLFALVKEFAIGAMIGFIANLIFEVIITFGQVVGVQMGHSAANVFDPASNVQISPVSLLFSITALTVFLILNGHHNVLAIVDKSYEVFPIGLDFFNFPNLAGDFIHIFSNIFIVGVKFLLPVLTVMFLADIFVALVAKILPQANMFFLFMPIKLIVGMLILSFALVGFMSDIDQFMNENLPEYFVGIFK